MGKVGIYNELVQGGEGVKVIRGTNVWLTKEDDIDKTLQAMYNDGELGGGTVDDINAENVKYFKQSTEEETVTKTYTTSDIWCDMEIVVNSSTENTKEYLITLHKGNPTGKTIKDSSELKLKGFISNILIKKKDFTFNDSITINNVNFYVVPFAGDAFNGTTIDITKSVNYIYSIDNIEEGTKFALFLAVMSDIDLSEIAPITQEYTYTDFIIEDSTVKAELDTIIENSKDISPIKKMGGGIVFGNFEKQRDIESSCTQITVTATRSISGTDSATIEYCFLYEKLIGRFLTDNIYIIDATATSITCCYIDKYGGIGSSEDEYTIEAGTYKVYAESTAIGEQAVAEGKGCIAGSIDSNRSIQRFTHAEGGWTQALGEMSHTEGCLTKTTGNYSHAEGIETISNGEASHAEGKNTTASGEASHVEGYYTVAEGKHSHAEGDRTKASGDYSHAEGESTTASGEHSHAEGWSTSAEGNCSHAEGKSTKATNTYAHVEGYDNTASGEASHAEGESTTASGNYSHAEGHGSHNKRNTASGEASHAEGKNTTASGEASHVEGYYTESNNKGEHAEGQYNQSRKGSTDADKTIHSVGIGTSDYARVNAHEIMVNGDNYIKKLYLGEYGNIDTPIANVQDVKSLLDAIVNGLYGQSSSNAYAPMSGKYMLESGGKWTVGSSAGSTCYIPLGVVLSCDALDILKANGCTIFTLDSTSSVNKDAEGKPADGSVWKKISDANAFFEATEIYVLVAINNNYTDKTTARNVRIYKPCAKAISANTTASNALAKVNSLDYSEGELEELDDDIKADYDLSNQYGIVIDEDSTTTIYDLSEDTGDGYALIIDKVKREVTIYAKGGQITDVAGEFKYVGDNTITSIQEETTKDYIINIFDGIIIIAEIAEDEE